jgi:hypothetical protein
MDQPDKPSEQQLNTEQVARDIAFIAQKQWKKVAQAIKEPQDVLIVEGYPVLDKRLGRLRCLPKV